MRLKDLFTIPTGQKVTEKVLRRVLISSVCSILLCMTCLVSTTWAWFTVSIENTGNVIEIATVTANVTIKQGENEIVKDDNGNYSRLDDGTYIIQIELESNATNTNELNDTQNPVYVLMSVANNNETLYYYFTFEGKQENVTKEISFGGGPVTISFSVSWVQPNGAVSLDEGATAVIGEVSEEPITDPTVEWPSESTVGSTTEVTEDPETELPEESSTEPSAGDETDFTSGSSVDETEETSTEPSDEPSAAPSSEADTESMDAETT